MSVWAGIKNLFREPQAVEAPQAQLTREWDTYVRRAFEWYLVSRVLDNPDKILKNKAGTFAQKVELYDEMIRLYPEISAHLMTRKLSVVNKDWEIQPNEAPDEIVDLCQQAIEGIDNFHEDLLDCLTAIERGFSVTEIIWKEAGGFWLPEKLLGRDQGDYIFDRENNLRLKTKDQPTEGEIVPPSKFIIHVHNKTRENWYGKSVLQDLYWPYYFWKNASKFWAMYVERFGMPTVIGKSSKATIDPTTRAKFEDFCKGMQADNWTVLPAGYEIEFKEPSAGRDQFSPFMGYWDAKVRLIILGQELTSYQAAEGTLGTTKIGNDVRQELVSADAKELSYAISNYLLRYVVELNIPYDGPLPKFKIKADPPEDLNLRSTVDERLSRVGYTFGKKYVEETYGVRGPEDETDVIEKPVAPAPPSFGFDEGKWVTIEGKHVFIGKDGQILKGGAFLKKQTERWHIGDAERTSIKKQIEENEDADVFGLRIDEGKDYKVGDEIQKSRRWDNGEVTDEILPGTSVVKLYRNQGKPLTDDDIDKAINHAQQYTGDQINLVAGDFGQHGEDDQEVVIKNAKVLAILKRKKENHDNFADTNDVNRDKLARIAVMRGGNLFDPWSKAVKKK